MKQMKEERIKETNIKLNETKERKGTPTDKNGQHFFLHFIMYNHTEKCSWR
jgi:hypothetical protein